MAKRCFSSQQLYTLRNDIAVQVLIEKTLRIPCRLIEGYFRFLCPLCNAFDTAVNPKTNLARCFRCEKNFNTIDLVMLIRQTNFVQSVKFLQSIHQNASVSQDRGDLETISKTNPHSSSRMKLKTALGKSDSDPCHIGKILGSAMSKIPDVEDSTKQKNFAYQKADNDRILKLEQKFEYLARRIDKLAQIISVGLPSK